MMAAAQAHLLPGGDRLYLHHGPIDLVIGAEGAGRREAFERATQRFGGVLEELVAELPLLRQPVGPQSPHGKIACAMWRAARRFGPEFITPMAAVAGAVADEVLSAMIADDLDKAYVNNGGDVAFYLTPGTTTTTAMACGRLVLSAADRWRGVATSGWQGRSHSLGIADSVTVIAPTAAVADAAATMVANAVDLPGHPEISRRPACELDPDSDLGQRPVTVGVGALSASEIDTALEAGAVRARAYVESGLIGGAFLLLENTYRVVAAETVRLAQTMEIEHA